MDIVETTTAGVLVLELAGRLDSQSAPELDALLKERCQAGVGGILLDFARVGYVSSAGLRAIIACAKTLKATEGKLVLAALNDSVFQVFEISGFARILVFAGTREEGLKLF